MIPIRRRHQAAAILIATTIAVGATATGGDAGPSAAPACLRCGATCDLEPICVCTPGTKKRPRVEYDVDCEPICLAGCASRPWQAGCRHAGGCTACNPEPCACPGRVRERRILRKETTDEEVSVIERKVAYVCGPCAGRPGPGCCSEAPRTRSPSWWQRLLSWLP